MHANELAQQQEDPHGQRLDQYAAAQLPQLSRAFIVKLIDQGRVLVNGQLKKPGYKLRAHDHVVIDYDAAEYVVSSIDLPVLYDRCQHTSIGLGERHIVQEPH